MGEELARIRIGHAERDAVTEVLRDAAAEGRIDMDELEDRLERALQARTFADLDPLVADLPVPRPSQSMGSAAAVPATHRAVAGSSAGTGPDRPLVLEGGWSSVARQGRWLVPQWVRINAGLGSVKLDCRQAEVAGPVIDILVEPSGGAVTIVVPAGWAANLDDLGHAWGSATSKVDGVAAPGKPLLRIHGGVGMGTLRVRHENWTDGRIRSDG